jgi:hypothetical protein
LADGCPWYLRWWHRQQRRADRAFVWEPLRKSAARRHPDNGESAALLALKGWAEFIQQPGQEHWRCACAEQDDHQRNG